MKRIITISLLFIMFSAIICYAADTPRMTVHDTENHGLYLTIGGTKVHFPDIIRPYIDKNNRTMVPIGSIADFLGYRMKVSQSADSVTLYTDDSNSYRYVFVMNDNKCYKNDIMFNMDTKAVMVKSVPYVPIRFLADMIGYEINYTDFDKFQDITITKKAGIQGFAKGDSLTLWGNIQDRFHEGDGLGSMMPFAGDEPKLKGNNINEYELKMDWNSDNEPAMILNLYWDTLYDRAYIIHEGILYSVHTDFARFVQSFLDNGEDISHKVNFEDRALFRKYGWTLDYKISTKNDILPDMREIGQFDTNQYYYLYNNELSKADGLDMSSYAKKSVTVDIYHIFESMPSEFYPIQNARGIVIRHNGKIIGAYISAGRHSVETACSLSGKSFKTVTGKDFSEYIKPLLKEEDNIVNEYPEEIIKRYFRAIENKNMSEIFKCISKELPFKALTVNMTDSELYNREYIPPFFKTVKTLKNLTIEQVKVGEAQDSNIFKEYRVTFDVEYEDGKASSHEYWQCWVIYESEKTGWKIAGFGH